MLSLLFSLSGLLITLSHFQKKTSNKNIKSVLNDFFITYTLNLKNNSTLSQNLITAIMMHFIDYIHCFFLS